MQPVATPIYLEIIHQVSNVQVSTVVRIAGPVMGMSVLIMKAVDILHITMTIYTVCQTNVVSVSPHTTIAFVAALMKEKNIGCVIITEDHKPVGIVTDRDLALRNHLSIEEKETTEISTIMTADVRTIRKDTGIFDAVQVMKSTKVRRLPVVDMGGRLVGLITVDDIIRLLARELGEIARVIGNESPVI